MPTFTISNFYQNLSQWNREFILDGALYSAFAGSYVYVMTTTGIMRYIYNQASKTGDFGVFNRDISYVSYEIPSNRYLPSVLGATIGFVNQNGIFCTVNMADGNVNKFGSWTFSLDFAGSYKIWSFISQSGNKCFVVDNTTLDVTYQEAGNFVGGVGDLLLSGFIKITPEYEFVVLMSSPAESVSGNFIQGGLAVGGLYFFPEEYLTKYYIRLTKNKAVMDYDAAISIIEKALRVKCKINNAFFLPIGSVFNSLSRTSNKTTDFQKLKSVFVLGYEKLEILFPMIVNPSPKLIQAPKVSAGFSGIFFSSFTKYLSTVDENQDSEAFSNYYVNININGGDYPESPLLKNGATQKDISYSHFYEVPTNNATSTSIKILLHIDQRIKVKDKMIPIGMSDSVSIQPLQVVTSIQ